MKALEILVRRWNVAAFQPYQPYDEALIQSTFQDAGIDAAKDLVRLYSTFGGMDVPDDDYWRLWPLHEVTDQKPETNAFGVLFSDYLLSCREFYVKPNDCETSAVYCDYGDLESPILVASTLDDFFDKYVQNADQVLEHRR